MTLTIDNQTQVCAVIGDPVRHSLSPCMHNAAFQALGLNYVYLAFHVKDVKKAADGMLGFGGIRGLSVTIPHKVEIMKYLDEISPLAQKIGAVNTVIQENGKLIGTNTDAYGALTAIEQLEKVDGKAAVILGVGGAARAVAFILAEERNPKQLYFIYREADETMAANLTSDLRRHTKTPIRNIKMQDPEVRDLLPTADILINTTPVGMHPQVDACPIAEERFNERQLVFDIIYNPAKTLLLQRAEKCGARILNGVPMFVYQGAEQFRLWTGIEPPVEIMEKAVKDALGYQ